MYKDSARVIPAKSLKPKINPKIVSVEQITKLIVDKNNFISFRGGYDWTLAKKHLPNFEVSAKANNNFADYILCVVLLKCPNLNQLKLKKSMLQCSIDKLQKCKLCL